MLKHGSMSMYFYRNCQLTLDDYFDLIMFGSDIGIDVFFTIVSPTLSGLKKHQKYNKIPASAFNQTSLPKLEDNENEIISMHKIPENKEYLIKKSHIMYATEYLHGFNYDQYQKVKDCFKRDDIGLSHHGDDFNELINTVKTHDFPIIEKHFYTGKKIHDMDGKIYRDCLHSLTPTQFSDLAKIYKG